MKKKWVAILMSGEPGEDDFYFNTKKQAEDYVVSRNCHLCKGEGLESACAAEWLIIKTKDYENSKCIEDLFKAAGYKEYIKEI